MNKTARNVLRLCVAARNLRRIPHCEAWVCYSHTATLPYSSYTNTKDNGLPMKPAFPNTDIDLISQSILMAETADDVFNIIDKNRSSLKLRHVIQAFKQLDSMYRLKKIPNRSIGKRIEFFQLCEILAHNMRSLDANHAVSILKAITHFGIPSTSVITQSLLQVIRSSLSQLSFHRLLTLEYQLQNFQSTPLADALKIAIPIMCEIQLNNKMVDTGNARQLADTLSILSLRSPKKESIEIIINAWREMGQNIHFVDAQRILKHLCHLEYLPPGYEEVVQNVLQILIKNMTQVSYPLIRQSLGRIVKKVRFHRDNNFYNEEFVDACAKAVISEDFGFEPGVKILIFLSILDHTHIRLIDYLAAKCFENPEILNKSHPTTVIGLIRGLATTDYKPIFWESMQEMVLKNMAENAYKYEPALLDFAVCMAVLDCFDPELINMVFAQYFLQYLLEKDAPRTYWNLLLLYQSVKLLYPKYNGNWPPETMIKAAMQSNGPPVQKSSVLHALEKAMGGSQYVLSNLKSKLGHHIDHVVIMRKGGYPMAVNHLPEESEGKAESVAYIEDLQLPAESQVIIVMNLPANANSVNSKRLKGNWTLLLKTLELQTGHTVIPISSTMWTALMDHEKIPYLMQAIRLKCDTLSASANI